MKNKIIQIAIGQEDERNYRTLYALDNAGNIYSLSCSAIETSGRWTKIINPIQTKEEINEQYNF